MRLLRVQQCHQAECRPSHDDTHEGEEKWSARTLVLLVLRWHISQPLEAVETRQDGTRRNGCNTEEGVRVQLVWLQSRNALVTQGPREV